MSMTESRKKSLWSWRYSWQLAELRSTALRHVVVVVLAVVVVIFGAAATRGERPTPPPGSPHHATAAGSTKQTEADQSKEDSSASQQHGAVAGASTQASPPPAVPDTAACKLLALDAARRVLGRDALPDTAKSINGEKTEDIAISTCIYVHASTSATLIVHAALTSLGASENALQFGSDKPAGVTDVPGYGQAAYWDSAQNELNILDNNNWLVLSRSDGSGPSGLDGVNAVAKAMETEL